MNSEFRMIGCGILVPAGLSMIVGWMLLCVLPQAVGRRFAGAVGCAIGFFGGYALLEPRHLQPSTYWQWLPWLGLVAAIAGPLGLSARVPFVGRVMLWLLISSVSAWLLVPAWTDLNPSRRIYVVLVSGGMLLLAVLFDALVSRPAANMTILNLCVSAFCGAVLLAVFVSLRFGLLAAAVAAAIAGCWVVSFRGNARELARGLSLFNSIVVGGLMLAGQVSGVLPSLCFALVCVAPLMQWFCEVPPLARVQGKRGVIIRLLATCLPLAAAFVVAG